MKILIAAATFLELSSFERRFEKAGYWEHGSVYKLANHELFLTISGIGAMRMAWRLASVLLTDNFELVINPGIGGSFDPGLKIGDVLEVVSERFGDLGAEDKQGNFLDLTDLELNDNLEPFIVDGRMVNPDQGFTGLPKVNGLTVNKTHGTKETIDGILEKYPEIQVESMEGAGFFYACLKSGIPFLELRSVSNFVEVRNKINWDISLAIKNLEIGLVGLIEKLD